MIYTFDPKARRKQICSTPMGEAQYDGGRVRSLDGLRGVAALVVVLNHCFVTVPAFADATDGRGRPADGTVEWWFAYTPVHVVWDGTAAVFIFFILSGFVLAGPACRILVDRSWLAYYVSRLARLYIPVWGSLILAGASALVVIRQEVPGASYWVNWHHPLDVSSALVSALLLGPVDFLNNPLWSLTWEVWFSLLLPVYIAFGLWSTRSKARTAAFAFSLCVAMICGPLLESNALRFLPMFAFGMLLYLHRIAVVRIGLRLGSVRWAWPAVAISALLLLTSYWTVQASSLTPSFLVSAARATEVAGALLTVVVAICWPAARALLENRVIQWLGARSFSLYLTHDIVVISATFLLGGTPPLWLTLLIATPASLLLAEIFYRVVERPSHRLSRKWSNSLSGSSGRDGGFKRTLSAGELLRLRRQTGIPPRQER